MARKPKAAGNPDYLLALVVAALLVIGLIMVYSTTYILGYKFHEQPAYHLFRQLLWAVLGTGALLAMMRIEYHGWQRYSILIMITMLLMLTALLFVGQERFGGQRWFLGGSVQPSELAKLAVVIYMADWLSSKGQQIRQVTYGLVPFSILIGLVTGLILLQPDFSTSLLIAATAFAMFFIAGGELRQLVVSALIGAMVIALLIAQAPYRRERLLGFLNPLQNPTGPRFQGAQALRALQDGGWLGQGIGWGEVKFEPVFVWHTDTIFAVLGEELGLAGCLTVLGLFALLAYRGFRIAQEAPDSFGMLLAAGITCWLIFQALINIAAVTAAIPFTGIPLPFISFGGSSLVTSLAGVGLLLGISRSVQRTEARTNASFDFGGRHRRARLSRSGRRRRPSRG
ncbi:MAG: putative lipid II flippase FtsW [Anaerolineae bacterium]